MRARAVRVALALELCRVDGEERQRKGAEEHGDRSEQRQVDEAGEDEGRDVEREHGSHGHVGRRGGGRPRAEPQGREAQRVVDEAELEDGRASEEGAKDARRASGDEVPSD